MTGLTDQWLRTEFQDQARTIDPPADLHQESMRRARARRKRRKGLQAAVTVGLAAAVTGVIVIVTGALSPSSTPAPADPAPASWTFDLYMVERDAPPPGADWTIPSGWRLAPQPVTVTNTGDYPMDVVNALLTHPGENKAQASNGFNFSSNGQYPIAEVNSVTVRPDVITVDLDRDVWDPYPNIDCVCPPGDIVMQQLVWTLDKALGSSLPVMLTINGEPARGIWGQQLNGPVSMAPLVKQPRGNLMDTLQCPPHTLTTITHGDWSGTGGSATPEEALADTIRFDFRKQGWTSEDFRVISRTPSEVIVGVQDGAGRWVALVHVTQGSDQTWKVDETTTCQPRSHKQ